MGSSHDKQNTSQNSLTKFEFFSYYTLQERDYIYVLLSSTRTCTQLTMRFARLHLPAAAGFWKCQAVRTWRAKFSPPSRRCVRSGAVRCGAGPPPRRYALLPTSARCYRKLVPRAECRVSQPPSPLTPHCPLSDTPIPPLLSHTSSNCRYFSRNLRIVLGLFLGEEYHFVILPSLSSLGFCKFFFT